MLGRESASVAVVFILEFVNVYDAHINQIIWLVEESFTVGVEKIQALTTGTSKDQNIIKTEE